MSTEPMRAWSQAGQDIVAQRLFGHGPERRYVEIGAGGPYTNSNSAMLESLGWSGLSIENDPEVLAHWDKAQPPRRNRAVQADALTCDWAALMPWKPHTPIHFLSVDVDDLSLDALKRFPLDRYRVGFLTFEHNAYYDGDRTRAPSREHLRSLGYHLWMSDVKLQSKRNGQLPFEDWWVDGSLANAPHIRESSCSGLLFHEAVARLGVSINLIDDELTADAKGV